MNNFNKFMEEKFMPIASKISTQKHLLALRDGLIVSMPLMIVGSMFVILNEFPSKGYQNFMIGIFGSSWTGFVWSTIFPATTNIVALLASFTIAYYFVKQAGENAVPAGAISLSAFLVTTTLGEGGWSTASFDSTSLFTALIIALISGEIYLFFLRKKIVIKLPDSVPPNVSSSFTALIPAAAILTLALFVKLGFAMTSYGDVKSFIFTLIQTPLKNIGTSIGGYTIFELIAHFLWIFGLHGHNIVNPIMTPMLQAASLENLALFQKGAALDNIITNEFITYVYIGGAGATLPLAFLMSFASKSKQVKQIGRLSLVPGLFNINEPLIFGLPIILNPYMIVPFILAPVVCILVAYIGISSGVFPMLTGISIPWTMPKILVGYLGTNANIMGALLVVINFIISGAIYFPFFKAWDKKCLKEEMGVEVSEE